MKKRKLLAVVLVLAMALSLLPTAALATSDAEELRALFNEALKEGGSGIVELGRDYDLSGGSWEPMNIQGNLTINGNNHTISNLGSSAIDSVAFAAEVDGYKYESLSDAISAVSNSGTVKLLKDVTLGENLEISMEKSFVLDLNGKTLTGRVNLRKGNMTVKNGTLAGGQALNVYGSSTDSANYSVLNVEKNVTINAAYGICVFPENNDNKLGYGIVVNVAGTINGGIFVSGNLGDSSETSEAMSTSANVPTINVLDDAKIDMGTEGQGIAMNGYAVVNVYNATITGGEAIGVKRGILNVYGGTLKANGSKVDPVVANNNGTEATGAAISMTSTYNYAGQIQVNVSGGTIVSQNNAALYVGHSQKDSIANKYVKGFAISVTGGSFSGASDVGAVYIADAIDGDHATYTKAILTGGTFSSDPSAYVANGYEAVVNTTNHALFDVIPAHKVYTSDAELALSGDYTANGCDGAIEVTGGTLTINGDGSVHALQCAKRDGYSMAVWAHASDAAKVIINGGTYTNEPDEWGSDRSHVDLIYASSGAKIEINGGVFKNVTPQWTLNCKDNSGSQITVKGGKFYQFDPSAANATNAPEGTTEVIVAGGYKVVRLDGDWYEVRADGVYTVTFDANGGNCTTVSALTDAQGKLTSLPTPTRSGSYSFNGWYLADGTQVTSSTVFTDDMTVTARWTYTGGSSSGSGSSSNTSTTTEKNPDGSTTTTVTDKTTGTVTETTKNTDGSTTTVETKKDGTVTETNKAANGTTGTVVTDKNGDVTEVQSTVSAKAVTEAAKTGEAVTLPVEVPAAKTTEDAPAVQVTVPKSAGSVKVEVPVEKVTPGTVAVIVQADGTEKIVSTSVVTENGVALKLDGSATVKIIDNTKTFSDVPATNVFYNEISSLSAREIMIGKAGDKFDLYNSVTLNQTANVAGRITGAVDVSDFNAGVAWGQANGLKIGNVAATRGDVLKALYIAAGSPAVEDTGILARFKDSASIPADMAAIAAWAAQNGILKGNTDGTAGLSKYVSRGQACALAGRTMGTLA